MGIAMLECHRVRRASLQQVLGRSTLPDRSDRKWLALVLWLRRVLALKSCHGHEKVGRNILVEYEGWRKFSQYVHNARALFSVYLVSKTGTTCYMRANAWKCERRLFENVCTKNIEEYRVMMAYVIYSVFTTQSGYRIRQSFCDWPSLAASTYL